jgi:CheY-like chemotaxis protein
MGNVIVIEDNKQNARLVLKLLKHAGHSVELATTGEEGIMAAYEGNPDVVILDMGLPDIDGQTVVSLLRQKPHLQNVPVRAFTAWPEDTAHEMVKAYGFQGIITKPIDTFQFVKQINEYIDSNKSAKVSSNQDD